MIQSFKKYLIILVILFGFTIALAQDESINSIIDSKTKNELWVDEIINTVDEIVSSSPKRALEYSDKIIIEAEKLNYHKGIIESKRQKSEILRVLGEYNKAENEIKEVLELIKSNQNLERAKSLVVLGIIYYETGKYDESIEIFDEAEELLEKEDNFLLASIETNRAHSLSKRGNYTAAVEQYLKAAKIYEDNNNLKELANSYNNIAAENRNLKLYEKSIEYYLLASEINFKIGNLYDLARNYSNIGVSYKAIDSLETALSYYNKSLELAEQLNANLIIAQNYVNMANIYEKKEEYKTSLNLFNKSLEICKRENIAFGVLVNYMNIGNTNFLLKNYEKAIINLDSALSYALRMKLPNEEAQVYERLTRVYNAKNDFQNAFIFQNKFKKLNDSLLSKEKHAQFLELQTKYETEKKEKEILSLNHEKAEQRLVIFYLLIGFLLLLIAVIIIIARRKIILNQKKVLEVEAENLKIELKSKNNELTQKALNIAELQQNNLQIVEELSKVVTLPKEDFNNQLKSLINKINSSVEDNLIWKEFESRFQEVHFDFYSKIVSLYPDLTPVELRIISLLRLDLSSKEISQITKRSIRTIENTRKNIRKKMNLSPSDNLTTIILGL